MAALSRQNGTERVQNGTGEAGNDTVFDNSGAISEVDRVRIAIATGEIAESNAAVRRFLHVGHGKAKSILQELA